MPHNLSHGITDYDFWDIQQNPVQRVLNESTIQCLSKVWKGVYVCFFKYCCAGLALFHVVPATWKCFKVPGQIWVNSLRMPVPQELSALMELSRLFICLIRGAFKRNSIQFIWTEWPYKCNRSKSVKQFRVLFGYCFKIPGKIWVNSQRVSVPEDISALMELSRLFICPIRGSFKRNSIQFICTELAQNFMTCYLKCNRSKSTTSPIPHSISFGFW